MKKTLNSLLATSCLLGMMVLPAHAETSAKEFKAFSKILSLSKDVPAGSIELGVVYDASNATSKADFDAIKAMIGNGFKGPKHQITLKEVTPADIASSGTPVLFITEGLDAGAQGKAAETAKANKVLTVSTDMGCVESGNCILGIDVSKGVKVLMNGNSYRDSGLKFDAAFEFMVKEI